MFKSISKLAAPVAGVVLLMSAGLATASAAPANVDHGKSASRAELVIKIGDRGGHRGHHFHKHHGKRFHALGPREIRRSLRHRGYHRINIIDRRGPVYVVKARGWRGLPMRLVVDARTAHIVRSRPLHRGHGHHRW